MAELKLRVFDLDHHIAWTYGAYGEDHDDRPGLVRLSLQRAHTAPADVVLIGDTPADVQGGHANAVSVIAVASGRSSSAALKDAGADMVLPDLRDTNTLTALVQRC